MAGIGAVIAAGGLLVAGLGIAPAAAAPTRDLYMVDGVQKINDYYVGEFGVLRKQGTDVRGAVGAFGSEYSCLKGKVSSGRFRGTLYPLEGPGTPMSFSHRWVGKGDTQRLKGFRPVSKPQLRTYLGGQNPDRFLRYCLRHV